ncbi:MAG: hypothetical protein ABEJ58_04540 [Halodesulfurarchaeum sp.]
MSTQNLPVTVESGDDVETVELPADLVDLFREAPEETDAEIVADVLVMSFAERVHAVIHHGDERNAEAMEGMESAMMDIFEDRFGMTFDEATGHSH